MGDGCGGERSDGGWVWGGAKRRGMVRGRAERRGMVMEYCLGDGDGAAAMWTAEPILDLNGDGEFEAIGLDFDGDGLIDDALADLDGDGLADHAVLDLDDDGHPEVSFTDDG